MSKAHNRGVDREAQSTIVANGAEPTDASAARIDPTTRTRINRYPARGNYERIAIEAILDEAMVCHVGFQVDGQPYVIPTIHARDGGRLFIHGSPMSRMLRTAATGVPLCLTVTLHDGIVLARSAFHHSMNYRSVVVLGNAREVTETVVKVAAMRALVDHLMPGRWQDARQPSAGEIAATIILELPLTEASAKVRSGGPLDSEQDYALPVWAGIVPLRLTPGVPVRDDRLPPEIELPDYVSRWRADGSR
jgi:nitroimidazol reductase NimA-like FMN-containing flavoprotein (pyridoxamine 5'-phosphate oxidase superfamily)